MFFKNSRYFKLENAAKLDGEGRVFETKELRLLPAASGEFQHIIEDTDRLDTLAHKYYKKSAQWWRICDANPEFSSPRGLLGNETTRVIRIDVEWDGLQAPWHELRAKLKAEVGVDQVIIGSEEQPYPNEEVFDLVPGFLFSMDSSLLIEVKKSIYAQQLTTDLYDAFYTAGYDVGNDIHFSKIVTNHHWRLLDQHTKAIYSIRLQEGELKVYESTTRFTWTVTVHYNEKNITSDEILQKVEPIPFQSPGFIVKAPVNIGRTGKPIIIPPILQGAGR